jgi:hypothetical protein
MFQSSESWSIEKWRSNVEVAGIKRDPSARNATQWQKA